VTLQVPAEGYVRSPDRTKAFTNWPWVFRLLEHMYGRVRYQCLCPVEITAQLGVFFFYQFIILSFYWPYACSMCSTPPTLKMPIIFDFFRVKYKPHLAVRKTLRQGVSR
jgi:hypothetical protein